MAKLVNSVGEEVRIGPVVDRSGKPCVLEGWRGIAMPSAGAVFLRYPGMVNAAEFHPSTINAEIVEDDNGC